MDLARFDRFTRFLAGRHTRRATLAAGVAALGATVAAPAASRSTAHAATPVADSAEGATPLFLYVQTFGGGTLEPMADRADRYLLTLTEAPAMTIAFADHPSRKTNALPTERLPEVLEFTEANPPNAALVTRTDDGEEIVLIIELLEPTYDPGSRTVTYQVIELAEYTTIGEEFAARAQSIDSIPSRFGITNLFIDSGGDGACGVTFSVCSSDDECCENFICVPTTCTPDDPGVSGTVSTDIGMCLTALA